METRRSISDSKNLPDCAGVSLYELGTGEDLGVASWYRTSLWRWDSFLRHSKASYTPGLIKIQVENGRGCSKR